MSELCFVGFDVVDGVADGGYLFGVFVRYGDTEFLLEFHDKLYGVEESAPRSLAKLDVSSISFSATFNLSFIISTTFDEISDITFNFSSTIFCK